MRLDVNEGIHLSEIRASDQAALVRHLNEREIYDRTLRIPFPYTEADAVEFRQVETSKGGCGPPLKYIG